MYGDSILSCCPRNPHGYERALNEEEREDHKLGNNEDTDHGC